MSKEKNLQQEEGMQHSFTYHPFLSNSLTSVERKGTRWYLKFLRLSFVTSLKY